MLCYAMLCYAMLCYADLNQDKIMRKPIGHTAFASFWVIGWQTHAAISSVQQLRVHGARQEGSDATEASWQLLNSGGVMQVGQHYVPPSGGATGYRSIWFGLGSGPDFATETWTMTNGVDAGGGYTTVMSNVVLLADEMHTVTLTDGGWADGCWGADAVPGGGVDV